jgi:ubiquinone/menaquinone biosynthesis C-methylase UbiE
MNQQRIWQHFQNESPAIFKQADGRIRFLVRQLTLRTKPGAAVLNVGIGDGLFETLSRQAGMRTASVDPDAQSIARLNALYNDEGARVGYVESLPFNDEVFDAVVVSELLEHLADNCLDKAINEIHRVLFSGGIIIGTVPAREDLSEQLIVCPCCGERFHRWCHVQTFDQTRMRKLLSQKFVVQLVQEKFLAPWTYLDWKGKTVCVVKNSFLRLGISWPGASLYFVAIKR